MPRVIEWSPSIFSYPTSKGLGNCLIDHPRTIILEFASEEAFRGWYDSAEYQAILPMRLESTEGSLILAKGLG